MNSNTFKTIRCSTILVVVITSKTAQAGPFNDPGVPGRVVDPANPAATILNPEIRAWASSVEEYNPAPGLIPLNSDATKALGPIGTAPDGFTVSLGDLDATQIAAGGVPGSVTLGFAAPFRDAQGWDLAVFENAFAFFPPDDDKWFAELAYVEVSSDGLHFARFPSVSLTTPATLFVPDFGTGPLRDFAGIDPTDTHNLAGVHAALVGTPFDLAELATHPVVIGGEVDLQAVRYVRVIDVPGDGSFLDSLGNGILDTWVTTDLRFGNGGFDLDAVAARYPVPEPAMWILVCGSLAIAAALARRPRMRRELNFRFRMTAPHEYNRRAWDGRARRGERFTEPARREDLVDPLATVDGCGWLTEGVRGKRLLCLAAGGGRHGVVYAAAGAMVTVVDLSDEMLALDRQVATQQRLDVRTVQASMDDLSMLPSAGFDIVIHPVSTCYVPDVRPVFREVARVLISGGLYISQHKQPASMQADIRPSQRGYELGEPYYREGPLPTITGSLHREEGTLEYLHRWEELLGEMCRAGFVIEDVIEPCHARRDAATTANLDIAANLWRRTSGSKHAGLHKRAKRPA